MILFKKANDLRKWVDAQLKDGSSIGFVPTMGALHQGHVSLVNASVADNTATVVSIFVNPTQFNDATDFAKYPVTIEKDIILLQNAGCDVLFLPEVKEMYPGGLDPTRVYDLGRLDTVFEGKYRPGHFQGVCRVVDRLLEIVNPHTLYMGQKDYQQCMVIRHLLGISFHGDISMTICPTLREKDGLAMSSRNTRLDSEARLKAPVIYQTLLATRYSLRPGDLSPLTDAATHALIAAGFKPDYFAIANADDLTELRTWDGNRKIVALVAAFLDDVRLIDNMLLN